MRMADMAIAVPILGIAVLKVGMRGCKTLCLSDRVMMARPHFAQHACCDHTPDGKQYGHKDKEPNAKGFHFFFATTIKTVRLASTLTYGQ